MTPDREAELYSTFPCQLIYRPGQGEGLPMQFGIECGDGWHALIELLLGLAQYHAVQTKAQPVVLQIKQKLGALRVYWRGADERLRDLTRLAEEMSESICEVCGLPGALVANRYGGRRTRCEAHRDISDPDDPGALVQSEQRPRTRRRKRLPGSAPLSAGSDMPDEVLVDAALLLASELGRLSISMLQVKLKIGYARAERLRNAVLAIASIASANDPPQE